MSTYNNLVAANCLVAKARLAVHIAEGPSPAWNKLRRVYAYLEKQADQAIEDLFADTEAA